MSDTNETQQKMLEQGIVHPQTSANKEHHEETLPQDDIGQTEPSFPQEEQRRVRNLVGVKVGQCLSLSPFIVLIF
jgi:hypothetical protein